MIAWFFHLAECEFIACLRIDPHTRCRQSPSESPKQLEKITFRSMKGGLAPRNVPCFWALNRTESFSVHVFCALRGENPPRVRGGGVLGHRTSNLLSCPLVQFPFFSHLCLLSLALTSDHHAAHCLLTGLSFSEHEITHRCFVLPSQHRTTHNNT